MTYICFCRQERAKRQQESLHDCPGLATPTKTALERINSVVEMAVAERSEVTHGEQLNVLAEMYSLCLGGKLIIYVPTLKCRHQNLNGTRFSNFKTDGLDFSVNID